MIRNVFISAFLLKLYPTLTCQYYISGFQVNLYCGIILSRIRPCDTCEGFKVQELCSLVFKLSSTREADMVYAFYPTPSGRGSQGRLFIHN